MSEMKLLRWLFVFAFYFAVELSGPVALPHVEAFEGEGEESIHRTTHRRASRPMAARDGPVSATTAAVRDRLRQAFIAPREERYDGATRKTPAPASDSPATPDDH